MTPDQKTEALKPCPKLEPCPLCRGISSWAFKRYANTGQLHGHKIRCESCGLEIESDVSFWTDGEEGRIRKLEQSRVELAIRWNTRAPAIERDAEVALRDAAEKLHDFMLSNPDKILSVPDEIYVPFNNALKSKLFSGTDFAERLRKAESARDALAKRVAELEGGK